MVKTIFATTDLSHRGDTALRRGFALARRFEARLIVLSIIDDAAPPSIIEELVNNARTSLTGFGETHGQGLDWTVHVEAGDPTGDILDSVEFYSPDLMIMGTHRERAFLDLLRETTAQRIVRLSNVPVLIAADRDERPYATVILGTDFSPNAAAGAMLAAELAPDARILPVHALHVPYEGVLTRSGGADELFQNFSRDAMRDDRAWRAENGLPAAVMDTEILQGSADRALAETARREDAHLIVVGAHGRVGSHRALLGSVASDLMRDPPCDVLIVRPKRRAA